MSLYEAGKNVVNSRSIEGYISSGSQLAGAGAGMVGAYGELFTNPFSAGASLNVSSSIFKESKFIFFK